MKKSDLYPNFRTSLFMQPGPSSHTFQVRSPGKQVQIKAYVEMDLPLYRPKLEALKENN